MPRLHYVKKARKDNPAVKAGESYYWWKFNYGPKMYSKTKPPRSRLTRSDFLATLYDLEDSIPDEVTQEEATDIQSQIEELRDMCEESLSSMPDHLQDSSDSGQLLQERIYGLEAWANDIECIDWEETSPEEASVIICEANPGMY